MIDRATMTKEEYEKTRKRFHSDLEQTNELEPNMEIYTGVQKYYGTMAQQAGDIMTGSNPYI